MIMEYEVKDKQSKLVICFLVLTAVVLYYVGFNLGVSLLEQ